MTVSCIMQSRETFRTYISFHFVIDCHEEAEPLHPKNHRMQLLLDLGANEADHGDVSKTMNIRDINLFNDSAPIRRPETSVTLQ